MQISELQKMTVIQLRKLAKENKVKLGAGIDKEGIVQRIFEELNGQDISMPETSSENNTILEELQSTPLSCDVTSVQPRMSEPSAQQSGYRSAWQNRSVPQRREITQRPSWQQPQRGGSANRFGPAQSAVRENEQPSAGMDSSMQRPQGYQSQGYQSQGYQSQNYQSQGYQTQSYQSQPMPETTPKLDGYRLGYRAAPQRPTYQNRDMGYQQNTYRNTSYSNYSQNYGGNNGYRPQYRNTAPQYGGYAPRNTDPHSSDAVYRMARDPQFDEQAESGVLPDMFQLPEGRPVSGILEILPDGYGFLRSNTLLPGKNDIYLSAAPIRRYDLRTGDFVEGIARAQRDSDKFAALLVVEKVNGEPADENPERLSFEELVPIYPKKRVELEMTGSDDELVVRLIDLIAPMGFGQRAMIITPDGADGLGILRDLGRAVKHNDKDAEVLTLLIDVAPEDATEFRENAEGFVFASTFADSPEMQTRVSETMLERAMRLVEKGKNVVLLLDSLTKLTHAYQGTQSQGGRPMGNTITPAALVKPKRFFGAARNTREGGSLTIIATINTETGSRTDDIIFEEFKGTANMEIALLAPQNGDPINPMLNLQRTGTKKDDSLIDEKRKESIRSIRKVLGSTTNGEAVVQLIDMMKKTRSNEELIEKLKDWIALWEKSGYLRK